MFHLQSIIGFRLSNAHALGRSRTGVPLFIAFQYLLFKLFSFGPIAGSTTGRDALTQHLPGPDIDSRPQNSGGCHQSHRFSLNLSHNTQSGPLSDSSLNVLPLARRFIGGATKGAFLSSSQGTFS
jgi:hypothetical protein